MSLLSVYRRPATGEHGHCTLEKGREKIEIKNRGQIQSSQVGALKHLALIGTGIALLPEFMARKELADGSLARVLPQWHSACNPVHAVYPRQRFIPARTRAFLDFLKQGLVDSGYDRNP